MSKLLIGYVEIPKLSIMKDEDIRALDVINLAFGHVIDGDVVCDMEEAVPEMERIRAVNPEIRIVLSVGGWSAGGFSEAAFTAEGRARFAKTAADLVKKYKLDGIDVDWEYPCISIAGIGAAPEDKENFTLLRRGNFPNAWRIIRGCAKTKNFRMRPNFSNGSRRRRPNRPR